MTMADEAEVLESAVEIDTPAETPSDTPADDGKPTERVTFNEEQQKVFDHVIGGKTRAQKDAERQTEELRKENQELRSQIPVTTRPTIPDLPEQFDDNFKGKMAAREAAQEKAREFDSAEREQSNLALQAQQQTQAAAVETRKAQETTFVANAAKLNLDTTQLAQSINTVDGFNLQQAVNDRLLKEPTGPAMINYLAKNPIEAQELSLMAPDDAVIHLATVIKGRAKVSPVDLPVDPSESLTGQGSQEGQRGPKGATFE